MAEIIYTGDGGVFKVCTKCDEVKAGRDFKAGALTCRSCINARRRDNRAIVNGYVDGARIINCAECGCAVASTSSRQKYCSDCSALVIKRKSHKGAIESLVCAHCAQSFVPVGNASKYCEVRCRELAANAARRALTVVSGGAYLGGMYACEMCGEESERKSGFSKFCEACRPEARKIGSARWREQNPEKIREGKARRRKDPRNRLDNRMGCAIWQCLRESKAGWRWERLVGYTLDGLSAHLERQFSRGMGWHNMSEWHVDHIIPKSMFKYDSPDSEEFKAAWALSNLRPLWASENLKKGNRLTLLA